MTHPLRLKTPYYSTTVPIWLDLVASPSAWSESFLSPEAAEVLAVLGGIAIVFDCTPGSSAEQTRSLIQEVGRVVKKGLGGWDWDGVGLAVGVGSGDVEEEWDELCAEAGLEFVLVGGKDDKGRNEFGGLSSPFRPARGRVTMRATSPPTQIRIRGRELDTANNRQRRRVFLESRKRSKPTIGPSLRHPCRILTLETLRWAPQSRATTLTARTALAS